MVLTSLAAAVAGCGDRRRVAPRRVDPRAGRAAAAPGTRVAGCGRGGRRSAAWRTTRLRRDLSLDDAWTTHRERFQRLQSAVLPAVCVGTTRPSVCGAPGNLTQSIDRDHRGSNVWRC